MDVRHAGCGMILEIAQPLEDRVSVHREAKHDLGLGNARRDRLRVIDRFSACLSRLAPRATPRTLVSAIIGGHYPEISARGRAVRPDAYRVGASFNVEVALR